MRYPVLNFTICGLLLVSCAQTPAKPDPIDRLAERPSLPISKPINRVTLDIQEGIVAHIKEQTRLGGGVFQLTDEERSLDLKLVRVHLEFLSKLGPGRHFACVDLATVEGDVFDVDFFLDGEPGQMVVSETTIHKRNGQPIYVWQQEDDKSWERVETDGAPLELLGVVRESDNFEFSYRALLPEIEKEARMWIPLATSDMYQKVEMVSITTAGQRQILQDEENQNEVLFLALDSGDSGKAIEIRYQVQRIEKSVYKGDPAKAAKHLAPQLLVPDDPEFLAIAKEVIGDKQGSLVQARALYDHVIERVRYAKIGSDYGHGDALYACDSGQGNCTDYHAYFIALARAVDIPARFAIGASIPSSRDAGGISGYHCWAEFYSEGHWWPVDISEADKNTSLSAYYFGNQPANRIELSRGRDIELSPSPQSGVINFLAYPILEVDGIATKAKVDFSFRRTANPSL